MPKQEEAFVDAISTFAQSTRDVVVHLTDALETHEESLTQITAMLEALDSWARTVQAGIMEIFSRLEDLERERDVLDG